MTGATGQVGSAVIALGAVDRIVVRAGTRDGATETAKWSGDARVQPVGFDFLDRASQHAALADFDSLFLLRPPQLTGDFGDLVTHIVFLPV